MLQVFSVAQVTNTIGEINVIPGLRNTQQHLEESAAHPFFYMFPVQQDPSTPLQLMEHTPELLQGRKHPDLQWLLYLEASQRNALTWG